MLPHTAYLSSSRSQALVRPGLRRLCAGLAATLIVALAAHVAMPLPFTPVPFTLQPLAVLAVGLFLGPVDGAAAMLAYLAEGAVGLPVFSSTGPGGWLQLLSPTGGYLLAYPAVAAICGSLAPRLRGRLGPFRGAAVACTLATFVLFFSGAAWLAHLHPISLHTLWIVAVAPFLPGEAVKIMIAAGMYRSLSSVPSR